MKRRGFSQRSLSYSCQNSAQELPLLPPLFCPVPLFCTVLLSPSLYIRFSKGSARMPVSFFPCSPF